MTSSANLPTVAKKHRLSSDLPPHLRSSRPPRPPVAMETAGLHRRPERERGGAESGRGVRAGHGDPADGEEAEALAHEGGRSGIFRGAEESSARSPRVTESEKSLPSNAALVLKSPRRSSWNCGWVIFEVLIRARSAQLARRLRSQSAPSDKSVPLFPRRWAANQDFKPPRAHVSLLSQTQVPLSGLGSTIKRSPSCTFACKQLR